MQHFGHGGVESATASREVHLRDYWKILWRGRYTALTIFLAVMGLTVLKLALATPMYEGSLILEIRPEARRILPGQEQGLGAEGGGWLAEEKYFNTQLEVLRSRDLAEKVYRQLRLQDHPRFKGLADPAGAFAGLVRVRPKVNTRLVTVSIQGPDRKEVREWVNALGDCYVKRNVDQATASFTAILGEIEKGMNTFRTSLGQADSARMQTMADQKLFVPESTQDVIRRNLETYGASLSQARVQIGALESELQNLDRIRRGAGDLLALPRFSQDPEVKDLHQRKLALEAELGRVAQDKLPGHPDYQAKSNEIKKLDQKMRDQIDRVGEKLRTEHRMALENASYLAAQIRTSERQSYDLRQASSGYELAKTESESRRKVYDVVAETMQRLTVASQLLTMNNNVSILDRAVEPRAPVRPRKPLTLGLGALVGAMLSLGTVLLLDYFDNTVRSPEDIEQYLGLAILAVVPKYRENDSTAAREAFQSLRTSILFSSHNREKKILLFTSAGPQEGKSNTVAQVARSLASAGDRVVVLDCDLRRPTQHHHMHVTREPGMTNYLLEGEGTGYEPFLHATDMPTLHLMTCGPIPPNPPELIGLSKFREMLARMRKDYDWVIVDSPPVASLADSIVLASMADMMAIVIKHNENDRELIRRSVKRLRDVNANIIGAVLNNVDLGRGADYYYSGYYYYGSTEEGKDRRRRRGGRRASGGGSTSQSKDRVAL